MRHEDKSTALLPSQRDLPVPWNAAQRTRSLQSGIRTLAPEAPTPQPPSAAPKSQASMVPAVLYQRVVTELEQSRQKVQELTSAKQNLESHNQALAQELQQVASELQGDIYRALTRLQHLSPQEGDPVASPDIPDTLPRASALPTVPAPAPPTAYSFLNKLKNLSQENPAPRVSPSADLAELRLEVEEEDPFDVPDLSYHQPRSQPQPSRAGSRTSSRTRPSRPSRQPARARTTDPTAGDPLWTEPPASPQRSQPLQEEPSPEEALFGLRRGYDDTDSGYGTSSYQRARDQQSAAGQSMLIWGILSLLLVMGCFTAGFYVVQSVVRGEANNTNSTEP